MSSLDHKQRQKQREMDWIARVLQDLQDGRFYGTLEIRYQGGEITQLIQHKSVRPPFSSG